eukprot:767058-Hanusia_phi.AAC.2
MASESTKMTRCIAKTMELALLTSNLSCEQVKQCRKDEIEDGIKESRKARIEQERIWVGGGELPGMFGAGILSPWISPLSVRA